MEYRAEAGIYIFTNKVSGKVYVGETINVKNRMVSHFYGKNQLFHRAIKKHGWENFDVQITYLPDFRKADLLQLEEELIKSFDCLVPKGYNVCPRGTSSLGVKRTPEQRVNLSNGQRGNQKTKGYKQSAEHIQKRISKCLGRKNTEEFKARMSEAKKGSIPPNRGLTDAQVSEIRNLNASGISQSAISRQFGVSPQTINSIVKGKSYRNVI